MNIGNQIKVFRLKKSVTQEAMAEHFGITAQAVSKWECGTSVPDISLLPELSAYFGVTIDFAHYASHGIGLPDLGALKLPINDVHLSQIVDGKMHRGLTKASVPKVTG